MGVGGHKHHYNDSHIEKEMKSIGDAVGFKQQKIEKNKNNILSYFVFSSFQQDPLAKLKELCGQDHACEQLKHRLQECTDRVNSKPWTKETCNEELLDFLHCVDECVS